MLPAPLSENKSMNMRILFHVPAKSVKYTDKLGSKIFSFIHFDNSGTWFEFIKDIFLIVIKNR